MFPASPTKMVLFPSLLVILACLPGSLGEEGGFHESPDLQKKVFVFPTKSSKATVRLNVSFQEPLTSISVCLKHHCPLLRAYSLFSYATRAHDNAFLIFKEEPNVYSVTVGNSDVRFKIPRQEIPSWEHICVSWNSRNGLIYFWLNGVLQPRLGTKKGYRISNEASIVLGQDQDTFGAGFDANQSFMGDLSQVNLWLGNLSSDDVRLLMKDDETASAPVLRWNAFNYTIQGYVVVTDEVP